MYISTLMLCIMQIIDTSWLRICKSVISTGRSLISAQRRGYGGREPFATDVIIIWLCGNSRRVIFKFSSITANCNHQKMK